MTRIQGNGSFEPERCCFTLCGIERLWSVLVPRLASGGLRACQPHSRGERWKSTESRPGNLAYGAPDGHYGTWCAATESSSPALFKCGCMLEQRLRRD
eukprot:768818-Hanusia_phi.AAC.12